MDWHSWNGKQNRKSTGHFFLLHFILLLVPSSWQKLTGSQLIKEKWSLPTPISKTKAEYINRRVSLNPRCLLGSLITGTCYLTHPGSLQFQELLLTFRTYIWFFSNLHGLLMNSVAFLCFLFHFKYLMPLLSQVLGCLNSILFSITSADTVNRFWNLELWTQQQGLCESESVSHSVMSTLYDSMDCSPPGSSVHGILQARILEWVAIFFSRGIFLTQGLNLGLPHCWDSLAAQMVKNLSTVQETQVQFQGWEDPLQKG